jgi:hypothetical protein
VNAMTYAAELGGKGLSETWHSLREAKAGVQRAAAMSDRIKTHLANRSA